MSVSSIQPVSAPATPVVAAAKPAAKPAAAPVVQAPTDADGDHDGTKGTMVNTKA